MNVVLHFYGLRTTSTVINCDMICSHETAMGGILEGISACMAQKSPTMHNIMQSPKAQKAHPKP